MTSDLPWCGGDTPRLCVHVHVCSVGYVNVGGKYWTLCTQVCCNLCLYCCVHAPGCLVKGCAGLCLAVVDEQRCRGVKDRWNLWFCAVGDWLWGGVLGTM